MRLKAVAALLGVVLGLGGCGRQLSALVQPNRAPSVEVTHDALPSGDGTQRYRVHWSGSDYDGRVVHYLYAIDPASVDRTDGTWKLTNDLEKALEFPRAKPRLDGTSVREPHVIAVCAIDDHGVQSPIRWTAFFEGNEPPTVQITNPVPSSLLVLSVGTTIRVTWAGSDPDGQFTDRPVKYKYTLLSDYTEFPRDRAIFDPDSLRRYYAPAFAGWDSTSGETTSVQFTHLTPGVEYLFVVTGFDELGDYDPVFSLNKNMLRFRAGFAKSLGPELVLAGEGVWRSFRGYYDLPSKYARVALAGHQQSRFFWFATPLPGSSIVGYRWVIDPYDLASDDPRTSPKDVRHWSERNLGALDVLLGPYPNLVKGETHRLYVEAEDSFGLKSLAILEYTVIPFRFQKDLLIVDDTRLRSDGVQRGQTCTARPNGVWPMAAELDTFLYARGGVPWTCYPAGTLTSPGIFNGYAFDTIGTRGLPGVTVPLSTLSRYRHVVWIVDGNGATYTFTPENPQAPMTALRWMSGPAQSNTLTAYARGGGRVWVAGGGIGYASQIPWNDNTNDMPTVTFSSTSPRNELAPGRMVYDIAAWRSEVRVSTEVLPSGAGGFMIQRYRGRFEDTGAYLAMPVTLNRKTGATDALPPWRTTPSDFYRGNVELEHLKRANTVVEGSPDPESTLDTLYQATGGSLLPPGENPHNVVMTYYHGPSVPGGVVFSGFNIWIFQRSQCVQLVDGVLGGLWGLARAPAPSAVVIGDDPLVGRSANAGQAGGTLRP